MAIKILLSENADEGVKGDRYISRLAELFYEIIVVDLHAKCKVKLKIA